MEKFSEEIWGEGGHFSSDLHKRRATEFESFKEGVSFAAFSNFSFYCLQCLPVESDFIEMNSDSYGYAEARSTYTVKPYPQKDPNKVHLFHYLQRIEKDVERMSFEC